MSKKVFSTVYGVRLYPLEYLMNEELTESDLNHLFDTKSLIYSLIINMFREVNSPLKNFQIINIIKNDNTWLNMYTWNKKTCTNFEKKIAKIYKNIYTYKTNEIPKSLAQFFIIQYGFNVKQ